MSAATTATASQAPRGPARRASPTIPDPAARARNGSTKIRWRDCAPSCRRTCRSGRRASASGRRRRRGARLGAVAGEEYEADEGEPEVEDEHACVAGRRVAGDVPEIREDLVRRGQSAAAPVPPTSYDLRGRGSAPERDREDADGREGGIAWRQRSRVARTKSPCEARTSAPYWCAAIVSSIVRPQSAQARPAAPLQRAEEDEVRERREEQEQAVHPRVVPWKSSTQLPAASAAAARAGARPASRLPRIAIAGMLAIAKRAESRRISCSPPPVCATIQASRKWSGAPPRLARTMSNAPLREWRPTNSGRVSSSCGGHLSSWTKRKTATARVIAVTPPTNRRRSSSRVAARKRGAPSRAPAGSWPFRPSSAEPYARQGAAGSPC